jgi:hypothetical protein
MKIVTKKEHRRNQSVTINGVTVKFDANLQSEVTEKEFEMIVLKDDSISKFVETPLKPLKPVDDKSKGKDLSEGKTDEIKNIGVTIEELEKGKMDSDTDPNVNTGETKTFAEELSEMKMGELKDLAIEAKLPEKEWKGIKKQIDLVAYLGSKLKE